MTNIRRVRMTSITVSPPNFARPVRSTLEHCPGRPKWRMLTPLTCGCLSSFGIGLPPTGAPVAARAGKKHVPIPLHDAKMPTDTFV